LRGLALSPYSPSITQRPPRSRRRFTLVYPLPMTTRRTILKSLSIVPAALLAPKVALGMGVGPRLVERPWDALVGLDLIQVRHSLKTKGYTMRTACGRSFVWGKYVPPGE